MKTKMNKMHAKLQSIFLSSMGSQSYLIQLKANALMYFNIVSIFCFIILSIALGFAPATSVNHRLAYALIVLTSATCIINLLLLRRGKYSAAANTLVLILFVAIAAGLINKTVNNPETGFTTYVYLMFPTLGVAGLFCTRRWLLLASAFCTIGIIVFYTIISNSGSLPNVGNATSAMMLSLFAIAITTTLSYLVVKLGEKAISRAEYLAGELKILAGSLEIKVEERTVELNAAYEKTKSLNESILETNLELEKATAWANDMAAKAEKARVAAEAASQAKGMFLSRMSHEIRTPMNSVIGFSDMLLDTEMNEEQVEFVRNITKSGEALLSLINEILDFSKIESGQLSFQNIDFDLEITAFDVCHITQPRLGNKPVEVFCRVGDNLPAFIKSDPTRLRQVLLNLLSNAIKFTHEGEIELYVAVEEENEQQLKLHITVRDTGIGIPTDKLETVFELFQQVDGSITRKYGGTGLGLAICKQIAKLMHGEIWVESELDKGSTFHFTAWVDKSDKVFVKQPQVEILAGKKALLVDDNDNNLNILSHVMQLVGMRSESIRRGDEVLPALQKAIAAKDPFDICILDIQMPDMSGYEVSKQVRKQKNRLIADLKLLAFSSSVTKRIKMFKESGFDGFLPKPIHRHTLITMLKRLLGEAGAETEAEPTAEKAVVITQHTLAEEAKHSVRILLAEDNPMNQKLAQYMLTKAGYQLEVADNGRETVEKYTADPERYDLIFMDVHMPEMDGLEATKVLRNRGYKEIPIIAMTADAMKEDRERCLESGMNDYMAKPIKREEVFNMIRKWVLETENKANLNKNHI